MKCVSLANIFSDSDCYCHTAISNNWLMLDKHRSFKVIDDFKLIDENFYKNIILMLKIL